MAIHNMGEREFPPAHAKVVSPVLLQSNAPKGLKVYNSLTRSKVPFVTRDGSMNGELWCQLSYYRLRILKQMSMKGRFIVGSEQPGLVCCVFSHGVQ